MTRNFFHKLSSKVNTLYITSIFLHSPLHALENNISIVDILFVCYNIKLRKKPKKEKKKRIKIEQFFSFKRITRLVIAESIYKNFL